MPDLALGRDALIVADLPNTRDEVAEFEIRDPLGRMVWSGPGTALGGGRYQTVIEGQDLVIAGTYTLTLRREDETQSTTFTFTVDQEMDGITLWDLRIQVASRINEVIRSRFTEVTSQTLVDDTLIGGAGNFVGRWILAHPSAGPESWRVARRVREFNGDAMILNKPLPGNVSEGTPYAMFPLHPDEVDQAIAMAIHSLQAHPRIPTRSGPIPVTNNVAPVPKGMVLVSDVYRGGELLDPEAWELIPGRRIVVRAGSGDLDLVGIRELSMPRWETSTLDIDPAALIAQAAMALHASRASGTGVDIDDHLRRLMVEQEMFTTNFRRMVGRVPNGARPVIQ